MNPIKTIRLLTGVFVVIHCYSCLAQTEKNPEPLKDKSDTLLAEVKRELALLRKERKELATLKAELDSALEQTHIQQSATSTQKSSVDQQAEALELERMKKEEVLERERQKKEEALERERMKKEEARERERIKKEEAIEKERFIKEKEENEQIPRRY